MFQHAVSSGTSLPSGWNLVYFNKLIFGSSSGSVTISVYYLVKCYWNKSQQILKAIENKSHQILKAILQEKKTLNTLQSESKNNTD